MDSKSLGGGILVIFLVFAVLSAGCSSSSNDNEKLRQSLIQMGEELSPIFDDIVTDTHNFDYSSLKTDGAKLSTTASRYHTIISGYTVTGNWIEIKSTVLKALENEESAGDNLVKAGSAFQSGDITSATTYLQRAVTDMETGTTYVNRATALIEG